MKKPFNNQLATQRLRNEDSVTGGNAPADTAATFKAGDGMQYATKKAFKKKNEVKDVEPKLAAGKANTLLSCPANFRSTNSQFPTCSFDLST